MVLNWMMVSIPDDCSGKVFQEFPGMVSTSRGLPFKQDNRRGSFTGTVSVDPHVSLLAVCELPVVDAHHFDRCFICMDDTAVVDKLMKAVKHQGQDRGQGNYRLALPRPISSRSIDSGCSSMNRIPKDW